MIIIILHQYTVFTKYRQNILVLVEEIVKWIQIVTRDCQWSPIIRHCPSLIQTNSTSKLQKYKSTQVYKNTSIQAYKHTSIQAYKSTSIQAYKHTSIQVYKHTSIHPPLGKLGQIWSVEKLLPVYSRQRGFKFCPKFYTTSQVYWHSGTRPSINWQPKYLAPVSQVVPW